MCSIYRTIIDEIITQRLQAVNEMDITVSYCPPLFHILNLDQPAAIIKLPPLHIELVFGSANP